MISPQNYAGNKHRNPNSSNVGQEEAQHRKYNCFNLAAVKPTTGRVNAAVVAQARLGIGTVCSAKPGLTTGLVYIA
jgi:hypothetical protein